VTTHEVPLERRTLRGSFSREYPPVLEIEPGDTVLLSSPDVAWCLAPPPADPIYERDPERDLGHALVGPIAVRGARAGQTLEVRIEEVHVGPYGFTASGGRSTPLNDRLGLTEAPETLLVWQLDQDRLVGRDQHGREVELRPFPGVLGMPPPEPGVHSTKPPRIWGGNIDCNLLVAGTILYLPIPVDGALFSAGDGHARQGDGELGQYAIECPLERLRLTLEVRADLELATPIAWTPEAWVALGFHEDLDEAAAIAAGAMLELMGRRLGVEPAEALALSTAVVDLRVTQLVNGVRGAHAVLRHDAIRLP
jgi:acetamidase/formamidase